MIDTEKLRGRILSLAMRGELSERNLQDGLAAELYSNILETKAELVKSGRIRKDKQYDAIEAGNIPYSIPDNWCWVRFGKLINLQSGQDLKPSEYNDKRSGIPYITGASNYESDGSIIINRWTDNPKAYAYEDDILLSCKGTVGKLTILREKEVHIARQIMGIRTYDVDVTFMFYYLQSMIYGIKEAQKGLIPGIERNDVLDLLCPLPPVPEQVRIVEKIEALFCELNKIEVLQNQYASNQKALKSKLIDVAIQGKLTEQLPEDGIAEELYQQILGEKKKLEKEGKIKKEKKTPAINEDELPFEIPLTWKWVRLSEIGLLQTGTTPSKSNPNYFGDYIPFLSPGEIQDNVITRYDKQGLSESGAAVARVVEKDSILQVCIGGSIGKTAINDRAITFNQQINSVTPYIINHEYIFYCLTSNYFISRITMASVGAATPIINKTNWGNLVIPLAPLAEQDRIVEKLNGLFANLSE